MGQERILFDNAFKTVNFYLKFSGITLDYNIDSRNFWQNVLHRWFFIYNFQSMSSDASSVFGTIASLTVQEMCFMIPCIGFCLMADFKAFFFVRHHHYVIKLMNTLRNLQQKRDADADIERDFKKKRLPFLSVTNKVLLFFGLMIVAAFFIEPTYIMVSSYLETGKVKLALPFHVWYPFDPYYNFVVWLLVFIHQFWAAWITVWFVYGPDCFYFTYCAFLHLQFQSLKRDMENIADLLKTKEKLTNNKEVISLIHRHTEIIKCVEMLGIIYGKSTLCNVLSSCLIICVAGFNMMIIDDLLIMMPFTPFFSFGSFQIFLFCYYGDLLMQDSINLSEALYNAKWYDLDASSMKPCLFMMMRAAKPCKITAYGFMDIDMRAFAGIIKSSWSYFTLLKTMYSKKKLDYS